MAFSNGWKKYLLSVAYNGSHFHGVTPNPGVPTIMSHVQSACEAFVGKDNVKDLAFSSRTDTGVHAFGNTAHVYLRRRRKQCGEVMEPHDNIRVLKGVNHFMHYGEKSKANLSNISSPFVKLVDVSAVKDDFHARHSAIGRTYMYHIRNPITNNNSRNIFDNDLVWTISSGHWRSRKVYPAYPGECLLDVGKMKLAASQLIGDNVDFSAFRSAGCQSPSAIKDMKEIMIEEKIHYYDVTSEDFTIFDEFYHGRVATCGNAAEQSSIFLDGLDSHCTKIPIMQEVIIKMSASSFLYNQVRNMVGYLVGVGTGKEDPQHTTEVLLRRQRVKYCAPPNGLVLMQVHYDQPTIEIL